MCLHLAKLLVLSRLLQFVARAKSTNLAHVRRSTRIVVTLVVLGDMVGTRHTSHVTRHTYSSASLFAHASRIPHSSRHFQVGIVGNFIAGARFISTLPRTSAAAEAFTSGPPITSSPPIPQHHHFTPLHSHPRRRCSSWFRNCGRRVGHKIRCFQCSSHTANKRGSS